ncbi:MAG: glycosyltransferase family 2 protein [Xanthomonadales bacterium]|nr:glycosyltransferase family 2 protein [Xanthomonadales bacterium]MCB1611016.1 glycosyltransferase family 2 protein [Xanthomonadales bacterium]
MRQPEVSVIVPVRDGAAHLRRAVSSALEASQVGEVIVIDDGSRDATWEEAGILCSDPRVRRLQHPGQQTLGVSASRNLGITSARCELLAFLDADDYYLPGRFDLAVSVLAADESVDGVHEAAGTWWATAELRSWWLKHYNARVLNGLHRRVHPDELFRSIVEGNNGWLHTSAITVRRHLLQKTGPFDTELSMCQDSAMWLKMAACGRLVAGRLDEPVAVYVVHGDNRVLRQRSEKQHYEDLKDEIVWRWLLQRPQLHSALVVQGCQVARRRMAQGSDGMAAWQSVATEYPAIAEESDFVRLQREILSSGVQAGPCASWEYLNPPMASTHSGTDE